MPLAGASGPRAGRTDRRRPRALRGRRAAAQAPSGDAPRAGQADRDGAARSDDVVEPRPDDRYAGERGGAAPSEAAGRPAPRTRARGAPASSDLRRRDEAAGLSPPVQRRDAAAGVERDRAFLRAAAADRRRAHDLARRDDSGPVPGIAE